MTHRHDEQGAVVATEPKLDGRDERHVGGALMTADGALGLSRGAGRVHECPGIGQGKGLARFLIACRRDERFIVAISRKGCAPEADDAITRDGEVGAHIPR